MTTTLPPPIAKSEKERSAAGLFAAGSETEVLRQLGEDLKSADVRVDAIIGDYRRESATRHDTTDPGELLKRVIEGHPKSNDLLPLVKVLYFAGFQSLLAKYRILFPAYNILDEYFVNATGPIGPVTLPRPWTSRSWTLLGRRIGFPIGVPASVLTANSRWIQHFASNGFNVLTYKTVRSRQAPPFDSPNWAFVPSVTSPLTIEVKGDSERHEVIADPREWVDAGSRDVSTTNSFGVPSQEPVEWQADLQNAFQVIASDQILIVSVMGATYDEENTVANLVNDYRRVALLAEEAGAEFIELNLSCPNNPPGVTHRVPPPLCLDVETTETIVQEVKSALSSSTRLIAKLAYMSDEPLANLVSKIATSVDAIAGINTLQCDVRRKNGEDTFPGRGQAGVSGIAIRDHALRFVTQLTKLRIETGHQFDILGMGGVTDAASFQSLFEAGSSAVQTATGAFANPFLAKECVETLGDTLPLVPPVTDFEVENSIEEAIVSMVASQPADKYRLASSIPLRASLTFSILDRLVSLGKLEIEDTEGGALYRQTNPA